LEIWKPHPGPQTKFHKSSAYEVFYGGALGGGKSDSLLVEALRQIDKPKYRALLLRRTFPELEMSLIRRSHELYPSLGGDYNSTKHTWTFPSGAIIQFGYCATDEDVYKFQCFHPDTEILTKDGFVPVAQVRIGQPVATLNPDTRMMEYQPATRVWAYDFDGQLITAHQQNGVSFAVTPNHEMLITTVRKPHSFRRVEARFLPSTAQFPQTSGWRGVPPKKKTIEFRGGSGNTHNYVFNLDDWLEFLGWYISEGCVDINNGRWMINIAQQKKRGRRLVKNVLNRLGVNYWINDTGFSFASIHIARWLARLGKSHDKYIPREYLNLPPEYLELLFNALIEGDGTWHRYAERAVYVTNSPHLKDDIYELGIKLGYRPSCSLQNEGEFAGRYHIGLWRKPHDTACRATTVQAHKGRVHCVTVEPYHSILIRYRNRVMWTGQSSEFAYIGFDEASHFTPFQYQYLLTRNRTPDKLIKKYVRAASNPGNVGHDFLKKRFIDGKEPFSVYTDQPSGLTRQFIPAKLKDNLTMMQNDPDYVKRLENMPPNKKKALLDGNWDVFEGQFFEDWHPEIHVIHPFDIPNDWVRFRAIDYGRTAPLACLWFAVDLDKNLIVYKEYYPPEPDSQLVSRTAEEHAKAVIEMSDGLEKYSVIGKDAFNKSAGAESPADIMRRSGLICTPANSDRMTGWSVVKEYLHWQKDNRGEFIVEPKIKFFANCYNLIRTLPNQIYATDIGMGQEFGGKFKEDLDARGEDHAVDALRFGVMSRRFPNKAEKSRQTEKIKSMDEDFEYSSTTY